jgi:hypothetical protein
MFAAVFLLFGLPGMLMWMGAMVTQQNLERFGAGGLGRRLAQGAIMGSTILVPLVIVVGRVLVRGGTVAAFKTLEAVSVMASPLLVYGAWQDPDAGFPIHSVRTSYLRGASLRAADLRRAALRWVRLQQADLTGADLTGADLQHAELARARLAGANLTDARLCGSDLSGADLSGARLTGADLSGARLAGARLDDAIHGPTTRWPEGFAPPKPAPPGGGT